MKYETKILITLIAIFLLYGFELNAEIIYPDLSNTVVILSYSNKNAIDLPGSTTKNAAKVIAYSFNMRDNQIWRLKKVNKGYIIESEYSRQVLSANPNDSSIIQMPFDGSLNQFWTIQSIKDSTRIQNNSLKLYLTSSVYNPNELQLRDYKSSNTQLWKIFNSYSAFWIRDFIYGSYIDILKRSADYTVNTNIQFPKFTYETKDNVNLIALRNKFKLDSIAGKGNEISKIINLMHWIHWEIPHDGNRDNPNTLNAESLISICRKEKRGLNCRGLATVLNECYLSMGFNSRFVTSLPKDSLNIDYECHVINIVYSNDLKKWIWIDPTNDAYIMNEQGVLLGIEEVRERLIEDKTLIINPDANWNRTESKLKSNYLETYMAKNLYRFICNVNSGYNIETYEKGKTILSIELIPKFNSDNDSQITETKNEELGVKWINYKCSDPKLFWQIP